MRIDKYRYSILGPIELVRVNNNSVIYHDDFLRCTKQLESKISELQEKLLNFEGQTFSDNQRIAELEAQNKKLVEALKFIAGQVTWHDEKNQNVVLTYALGTVDKAEKLLKELEIK